MNGDFYNFTWEKQNMTIQSILTHLMHHWTETSIIVDMIVVQGKACISIAILEFRFKKYNLYIKILDCVLKSRVWD